MGTAEVLKVIDPQTILLHDGRTIRLSSLYFPDYDFHLPGDFSLLAKKILEDMLLGQAVNIYQTPRDNWGRTNRMGHQIAHLQRQSDKSWVQGVLLSLGLAQVQTGQRTPEMAEAMYAIEDQARSEKIGVWEDEKFQVKTTSSISDHLDSFQIVEGIVTSTALKSNRVFLNFGKDWRKDFTVSVSPEDKKFFVKQGYDPLAWNKKYLRVRGWVRDYNGPFIEINHPQAVEVLEKKLPYPLKAPQ